METKGSFQLEKLAGCAGAEWVRTYFELSRLKQLYRQGWLKRGLSRERCESVADHSFAAALLAYWLARAEFPELDAGRVLSMALMHDLGEVYVGDLIPQDKINPLTKHEMESQAVNQIFANLPEGDLYIQVWEEYEAASSPEARFVRQIDRLEMALQASLYEHQGERNMQEFFDSAGQAVSDPRLRRIFDTLLSCRENQTGS
ncbi:MAG TPA: HD domain-containing protein [Anaerolineales bacterium]|nr:HD domain-containing protein [Anaerolineales bacterium]